MPKIDIYNLKDIVITKEELQGLIPSLQYAVEKPKANSDTICISIACWLMGKVDIKLLNTAEVGLVDMFKESLVTTANIMTEGTKETKNDK